MYRSYTKNFRIFGAIIIFLQIPKVLALFTISENTKSHCSSSSLSLTARPRSSVTQRGRTAALSASIGKTRRRQSSGEADRTYMTYSFPRTDPRLQKGKRRTGDSSPPGMAAWARRRMA